jgi:hemoglobin
MKFLLSIFVSLWLLAGAASADDSLYKALGERQGLVRIVDNLLEIALADERIKHTFDNTNIDRLKGHLVDQFCMLSGGPCTYRGRDMKKSHAALHLTNLNFNALVEDLQIAMDRENVPFGTQNELLGLLAPMQRDVVTR